MSAFHFVAIPDVFFFNKYLNLAIFVFLGAKAWRENLRLSCFLSSHFWLNNSYQVWDSSIVHQLMHISPLSSVFGRNLHLKIRLFSLTCIKNCLIVIFYVSNWFLRTLFAKISLCMYNQLINVVGVTDNTSIKSLLNASYTTVLISTSWLFPEVTWQRLIWT